MSVRPRIAIYARYSTDRQSPSSSQDQATACNKLVDFLEGVVVDTYLDPEIYGYRRDRPALTRLLADVKSGKVDIVVTEALDRLARDAEDVAWLGKKLQFHRVRIHTVGEGEIDEIKLAVASLLGALFISQLRKKTIRGMEAAILAGRFTGGRSYGYKRVIRLDRKGELVRGLLEIDPLASQTVLRIFKEFAAGLSSIQIATRLNVDGIAGPRGGQWNASTIRGDQKKAVGILNNPLYVGELVWKRREWRRDPDSAKRERVYRMRDKSEWVEIPVPDLRIVPAELARAVADQIESRKRPDGALLLQDGRRKKHLLSGLIRCSVCGSNYTISGKDYYRCAGQKERGTCSNRVSVRKQPLESMTLSMLQRRLLTTENAQVFAEEFNRELQRLAVVDDNRDTEANEQLRLVQTSLDNLAKNMEAGVISPTLMQLLTKLDAEKATLEARLAKADCAGSTAEILPHPLLLERFRQKIGNLVEALDDAAIRPEAVSIIAKLIESVTIYPDGEHGPEAEVAASIATLMSFASNENTRPGLGLDGCSVTVVAGTGFEPVTFRL